MIYTTSFGAAIMAWILYHIITNKYGKMFLMAIGFMLYGLVVNALLNTWIGYGYVFLGFFFIAIDIMGWCSEHRAKLCCWIPKRRKEYEQLLEDYSVSLDVHAEVEGELEVAKDDYEELEEMIPDDPEHEKENRKKLQSKKEDIDELKRMLVMAEADIFEAKSALQKFRRHYM